ncbi:Fosmidomycin resistance protein (plasmid) [Ralstonia solanacearum]|nr:Fosmidomycin resistance protein [Ralstonia solanacearum]
MIDDLCVRYLCLVAQERPLQAHRMRVRFPPAEENPNLQSNQPPARMAFGQRRLSRAPPKARAQYTQDARAAKKTEAPTRIGAPKARRSQRQERPQTTRPSTKGDESRSRESRPSLASPHQCRCRITADRPPHGHPHNDMASARGRCR